LVERDLPKVDVASSNLVIRSMARKSRKGAQERDTLPNVDVASSNLVIRSMARKSRKGAQELHGTKVS
jgi:hypothetical protein